MTRSSRLLMTLYLAALVLCIIAACQLPDARITSTRPPGTPDVQPATMEPSVSPVPPVSASRVQTTTLALVPTPTSSPAATLPQSTPGNPKDPPIFGVALRGEINDAIVQELIRQAGIHWVRTSLSWAEVEPSPGVFEWAALDAHLSLLAGLGVTPIVYIAHNPSWAATSPCGPIDKVPLDDFAAFVFALASRYNGSTIIGGRTLPDIRYWQFYNEPDNRWTTGEASTFDGCWGTAPDEYARMLTVAWRAVHGANPQARVVFGGIAGESVSCPSSWSCAGQPIFNFDQRGGDFVDQVLSYMQTHPDSFYFDVFDFHYFPAFHSMWDGYGSGLYGKAIYYRDRMQAKGIVRPMMCTETGRRSDPKQTIDGLPGSDREQSRYLVRLFVQGKAANLLAITWFTLTDIVEPQQGGFLAWGLLDADLHPKTSYEALKTLTRELNGTVYRGALPLDASVEAHSFTRGDGETIVLWTRTGSTPVRIKSSQVTLVDMWGHAMSATDGAAHDADRAVNGSLTLIIGEDPVYVRRQR